MAASRLQRPHLRHDPGSTRQFIRSVNGSETPTGPCRALETSDGGCIFPGRTPAWLVRRPPRHPLRRPRRPGPSRRTWVPVVAHHHGVIQPHRLVQALTDPTNPTGGAAGPGSSPSPPTASDSAADTVHDRTRTTTHRQPRPRRWRDNWDQLQLRRSGATPPSMPMGRHGPRSSHHPPRPRSRGPCRRRRRRGGLIGLLTACVPGGPRRPDRCHRSRDRCVVEPTLGACPLSPPTASGTPTSGR